jgi:hypothetical protein
VQLNIIRISFFKKGELSVENNFYKSYKNCFLKYLMNIPSEEQQIIIDYMIQGKNVIVDACAGSGKSTTILSIAKQMPNKKILQITYNSALRKEIRDKVLEYDLKNITIHTYHSLAVNYYSIAAYNDMEMRRVIYENLANIKDIVLFDILVIDEAQDMSFLYYLLVRKFIKDSGFYFQIMILGDYKQGLYDFKGADIRYLTFARQIWENCSQLSSPIFEECRLKVSYRITNQMADFINNAMLGECRLFACKEGYPVKYIRSDKRVTFITILNAIREILKNGDKPGDIFILAASVKMKNYMIRHIENILVEEGIPCHIPTMDTERDNDKVIENKLVFSTFHTAKGRQRKYVFVLGFDQLYMEIYGRNWDPIICPNTLYVGTTRATHELFLFEKNDKPHDRPLDFINKNMSHVEMRSKSYIDFRGIAQTNFFENPIPVDKEKSMNHYTTPTELIQFIKESVLIDISPIIQRIFIRETSQEFEQINGEPKLLDIIEIPSIIKTKMGFHEDISNLNGIAIPALFYDYISSHYDKEENILYDLIKEGIANFKEGQHMYLKKIVENLNPECETINDYLYMANIYYAIQEKVYFKLKQIGKDEYNWLSEKILVRCKERIAQILEEECLYDEPEIEKTIICEKDEYEMIKLNQVLQNYLGKGSFLEGHTFHFTARIDLLTYKTLWEIKCTSEISMEHMIQVIIYAWIWRTLYPGSKREIKIFNIKTGEILRLETDNDTLTDIVGKLLKGKYEETYPITDEVFLNNCKNISI